MSKSIKKCLDPGELVELVYCGVVITVVRVNGGMISDYHEDNREIMYSGTEIRNQGGIRD